MARIKTADIPQTYGYPPTGDNTAPSMTPRYRGNAKIKPPHGSSLEAKPVRVPHPTIKGRDTAGRMMPGITVPGAAPPFQKVQAGKQSITALLDAAMPQGKTSAATPPRATVPPSRLTPAPPPMRTPY